MQKPISVDEFRGFYEKRFKKDVDTLILNINQGLLKGKTIVPIMPGHFYRDEVYDEVKELYIKEGWTDIIFSNNFIKMVL